MSGDLPDELLDEVRWLLNPDASEHPDQTAQRLQALLSRRSEHDIMAAIITVTGDSIDHIRQHLATIRRPMR
jgi:hypothetical protein